MPIARRPLLALLALPTWPAPARAGGEVPAATLRMVSEVLPPYVLPEGHAHGEGIDVDIARQALGAAGGLPIRVDRLPWRRALALLESGAADLAPGVRRTPQRELDFAFSHPYGGMVRHRAFSAVAAPFTVRAGADLAALHVGLVQGYAYPEGLLAALGPRVTRVNDEPALLRIAAAGRVDVALATELRARWTLQQLGLAGAVRAHPMVYEDGHRTQFAVSRRSERGMASLPLLNRGLVQLEAGGWSRFERPYLQPE